MLRRDRPRGRGAAVPSGEAGYLRLFLGAGRVGRGTSRCVLLCTCVRGTPGRTNVWMEMEWDVQLYGIGRGGSYRSTGRDKFDFSASVL